MRRAKKLLAMLLSLALLLSFIPVNVARADGYYELTFNVVSGTHTITVEDGHLKIDGGIVELRDNNNHSIGFATSTGENIAKITVEEGLTGKLNYGGQNFTLYESGHPFNIDTNISSNMNFGVQDYENGGGNGGGGDNPSNPGPNQVGGPDDITFHITCVASDCNIKINEKNVKDESDQFGQDEYKFDGTIENAGTINPGEVNILNVLVRFGDYDLKEVEVNGVTYKEGMDEVAIEYGGWFITVPADHTYTITCWGDPESHPPRTIIWTNPDYVPKNAEDAAWIEEFSLDHGYAYVKAIYDKDGNEVDPAEYIGDEWQNYVDNGGVRDDGFGWVSPRPESRVIFKFVPEYGYQLTDIRINGNKLGLSGLMNEFEFIMPDTNIHFDAEFTKTEDIVKAASDTVTGGSIVLGNELSGGSAQLLVDDAEVSADKKADFEKAAGDYEVTDILDIDLNQVFYKGKNDADDVWANEISELEKDATISLKLDDDVNVEDVVIVHNVHDGSEFETIKVDSYDSATNTITFKTKSFSNFAIATKDTSTGTVSSEGILVIQDSPSIVAGLVHAKSDAKDDVEFRWVACEENAGVWFEISPWTKNNEWLNWTPDEAGNYVIVCYARVKGNSNSQIAKYVGVVYSKHVIKDICQIPYEDGYLIGFESTQNPNQSYQYEMLVMDLTLYAAGNPNCWILSTGRATVSEGNAIWITWKPEYGYYLTLFRVYDGNGKLLDQTCYGFANAY